MPNRKAGDPKRRWVTFDISAEDHKDLDHAAKEDGRTLKEYLRRVLAGHAVLLRVTDSGTRAQLADLSRYNAEQQEEILSRVREQFKKHMQRSAEEESKP